MLQLFGAGAVQGGGSFAAYARAKAPRDVRSPTWKAVTGATESAGVLTKTASTGWGNAGAVSVEGFSRDCRLVYRWQYPFENLKMIGLSTEPTCVSYDTIDHGLNLEGSGAGNGDVVKYHNSAVDGATLTTATGVVAVATIEIIRIGRTIRTFRGNTNASQGKFFPSDFTVLADVGATLYVHVAMYGNGVVFDAKDMLWNAL